MTTTLSARDCKSMISVDEQSTEPQELTSRQDSDDADGLLLHLIRTIALYLFVLLSQTATLSATDAELAIFVSDAATPDSLDVQAKQLQRRLHAALFAWVQNEVNSNQFDGLVKEQRAFAVIKSLFKQQRAKTAAQCSVLAALLSSYLTQLQTPLVHCEPTSMLSSTLEYLLAKEKSFGTTEPVPLAMLYPLVNAVDLVSIEQRECLDALMNLLRWLTAHDLSQKVFTTFASKYHVKIIGMERGDDINSSVLHSTHNTRNSEALSVCFVQMLLRYSDHIFRRDLQLDDMVPTLAYSDTEDDDFLSEDCSCSPHLQSPARPHDICESSVFKPASPTAVDSNLVEKAALTQPFLPTSNPKSDAGITVETGKSKFPSKTFSRSLRKRKKREEKLVPVGTKTSRRGNRLHSKPFQDTEVVCADDNLLMSQVWTNEEQLPAVVCVGIAAAAGTIAAVLCAFFSLPVQ